MLFRSRAQGQFQDAGDLLVTMALDVAQQDAGAILGPEAGDGVLDGAAQLARFELLQGGFTRSPSCGAVALISSGVVACGEPSSERVSSSRLRR